MACSRAHAAMNVWMSLLVVALDLKKGYPDQFCHFKTGFPYLLTGQNCPLQAGHNDSQHTKRGNMGLLPCINWRPRQFSCVLGAKSLSNTWKWSRRIWKVF